MCIRDRQCIVIPINLFGQIVSDSAVVKACVEECLSGEVQTEFISQLVIFNSFKMCIRDRNEIGHVLLDGFIKFARIAESLYFISLPSHGITDQFPDTFIIFYAVN